MCSCRCRFSSPPKNSACRRPSRMWRRPRSRIELSLVLSWKRGSYGLLLLIENELEIELPLRNSDVLSFHSPLRFGAACAWPQTARSATASMGKTVFFFIRMASEGLANSQSIAGHAVKDCKECHTILYGQKPGLGHRL